MKKYLIDAMLALIAVFAPIQTVIFTVGALVLVDMGLGIWAAKKSGEEITSERMSHTVIKTFVYEIAVLMAYLVETYLMGGILPVCKIVASLIGSVELKSILENCQTINGGKIFDSIIGQLKRQVDQEIPAQPEQPTSQPPVQPPQP